MALDTADQEPEHSEQLEAKVDATLASSESAHERLSELSASFHLLQAKLISEPGPEQGAELQQIAQSLMALCETHIDQVLGELFLSEQSSYNFTKPLYIAASLVELMGRFDGYNATSAFDDEKREQMAMAALGFNLGLLAYEKQIYESQEEFSFDQKRQLREHYPQQSGDLLKAAGLDQMVIQDVVRNHNVASENPSQDALMMRTPFIYAGIALPQNRAVRQQAIDNPSREFARMFTQQELDPVYGGLFLKINGLAPIGAILNYKSREKAIVIKGPVEGDISASTVRMLANQNGVQLRQPGDRYGFKKTPSALCGLADHHQFAWTRFAPYAMWLE